MQDVSQAWINAQQQTLVPESFVEVTLTVGDPAAAADATAESNGEMPFSDAAAIVGPVEQEPLKYATFEENMWLMDGSFSLLPASPPYGANGYISTVLSGADGSFSGTLPTITINFSHVFTSEIPGISILWGVAYDEWPVSFRVTAYNGSSQVAQTTVADNTDVLTNVTLSMQNYDQIVIEVLSWCYPYHRARIAQITIGEELIYLKSDLMSYKHTLTADPLSGELPNAEIAFEVSNLNGQYNPDNPQGVEQYMMERQQVTVRYGYLLDGEIEWIPGGVFFLSEWDCPQNGITASFKARDAQEYMTDLYAGPSTGTLMAIATSAFQQANMPVLSDGSNRWSIDSSLSSISAPSGVNLADYTIKEVLQLCANAACCVMFQDRAGMFHIEPLATGATTYPINQFNSYQNSEVSLSKQLRAVDINNGLYTLSVGSTGDTQQINNPLISAAQAPVVAKWVAALLSNRRMLSGEFRADPRMDVLDRVVNTNSFSTSTVLVTEVVYTYNGAFRGTYSGRSGA